MADACETMLVNSEAVQRLAYAHYGTARKIWEHIKGVFRRMQQRAEPQSREAVLLKNQYDTMRVMWDNALEQAVKNSKAAQAEASTEVTKEKSAPASEAVEWQNSEREEHFARDKFFDRQVDQWDKKTDGTRIKVGELKEGSALNRVGFPATGMWFDVGKIRKSFGKHGDHLTREILKQIPNVLSDPIAITEYRGPDGSIRNTVNVFGLVLPDGKTPVVVGVMMTKAVNGTTVINKIRTIHAHGNAVINDANILYLNEDKKRTRKWFQVCGNSVPLNGTTFGLIRSIAYTEKNSNTKEEIADQNRGRADNSPVTAPPRKATPSKEKTDSEMEGVAEKAAITVPTEPVSKNIIAGAAAESNTDFQSSLRDDTSGDTEAETAERVRSYNRLKADNEAMRRQLERARREIKPTKEAKVSRSDAVKAAKKILEGIRCGVDALGTAENRMCEAWNSEDKKTRDAIPRLTFIPETAKMLSKKESHRNTGTFTKEVIV